MKLDYSKFKKLHADDECTTLKHPAGHELKIHHKSLSPKLKEELHRLPMAEGGEAAKPKPQPQPTPKPKEGPVSEEKAKAFKQASGFFADGGEAQIPEIKDPQAPVTINIGQPAQEPSMAQSAGQFVGKHLVAPVVQGVKDTAQAYTNLGHGVVQGAKDMASGVSQGAGFQQPAPGTPEAPAGTPVSSQDGLLEALQVQSHTQDAAQAQPTQPGATSSELEASQKAPEPEVKVQESPQAQAEVKEVTAPTPEDQRNQTLQDLHSESQAFEQDLMQGHIQPKTYHELYNSKDTLGKVGTLFGLLLSGVGSGLTGQPNAVLKMMDQEIERDLDAQKSSAQNVQNFYKLNQQNLLNNQQIQKLKQEGKLTESQAKQLEVDTNTKAYALAQTQMLQTTYHSLVDRVNKLPEGPQKQQAQQTLGIIYPQIGAKINDVFDQAAGAENYYRTLFGSQGGQSGDDSGFQNQVRGMRMLGEQGEKRAQDLESKHFPGLEGQASVPLSSGDREKIDSGVQFDKKLNRFIDWTKGHSGDLNPATRKEGEALAAELQGAYRQATHGGVYKEGEQNFISKLIDSTPTKFFNEIRVLPSLNALDKENKERLNTTVKNLGFKGYSPKQDRQESPQIKIVNGVKYRRGPNGEAVKVE